MLAPGDQIPDVTVYGVDAEPVPLRGLGAALIAFYLYDWTGTWRSELRLLRDRRERFRQLGVAVVGVSRDSPYSHLEWSRRLGLGFPLLSDWNAQAVRAFGVSQTMDDLLDTPVRSAFLVDAAGVIRFAHAYGTDEVPDVNLLIEEARSLGAA